MFPRKLGTALATRKQRIRQVTLWIAKQELPASAAHPFLLGLNELLDADKSCSAEAACRQFYAKKIGRPSLSLGISFRALLVGYFESQQALVSVIWRCSVSFRRR